MDIFRLLTPISYWFLIVVWSIILVFYISRLLPERRKNKLFITLIIILSIDAFRTLFESIYFGAWYTSVVGLIPENIHELLIRPENVFIPKFINVMAAVLVLSILLLRWLPQEEEEQRKQKNYTINLEAQVSERKKMEESLRESEERFRQLSEAPFAGVLLTERRKVFAANKVFADMFGYDAGEISGMDLTDFVTQESKVIVLKNIETAYNHCYEVIGLKKNGEEFPVEACGKELLYNGRKIRQSSIRDISESKRAELEKIKHEKLQGVIEMAGAVCHELNQPMMAILGYSDILSRNMSIDSDSKKKLQQIKAYIGEMGTITKKLMKITRYETKDYAEGRKIIDIERSSDTSQQD